ncbi:MAG: hypothetical protein CM15mP49_22130 [Actinomycetota bacterium]|nr:MAG: hypothetical protein CM15mP49_22130 [Actinomycetota bacterium]
MKCVADLAIHLVEALEEGEQRLEEAESQRSKRRTLKHPNLSLQISFQLQSQSVNLLPLAPYNVTTQSAGVGFSQPHQRPLH